MSGLMRVHFIPKEEEKLCFVCNGCVDVRGGKEAVRRFVEIQRNLLGILFLFMSVIWKTEDHFIVL